MRFYKNKNSSKIISFISCYQIFIKKIHLHTLTKHNGSHQINKDNLSTDYLTRKSNNGLFSRIGRDYGQKDLPGQKPQQTTLIGHERPASALGRQILWNKRYFRVPSKEAMLMKRLKTKIYMYTFFQIEIFIVFLK